MHASLASVDVTKPLALDFALDLRLQGTSQLDIKPVGRDTRVTLNSDWPHPAFVGDYLPVSRTVNDSGFSARWSTSFFSTNLEEALQDCTERSRCESFNNRRLGVSFMDPVDHYVKSDRATKYALLFIALTFAGFFLFEVLKALAVHPVQYGMVGLALAFFYLLLLSLTEHIGFALAYGVSATLCVGLIGYYVGHVLQGRLRGASFCASLAALYGLLYGLLSAEDYALLMGSLLLFGLLGVVMVMTRKVDWFKAGNQRAAE